jgi:hypothetical protein
MEYGKKEQNRSLAHDAAFFIRAIIRHHCDHTGQLFSSAWNTPRE